MLLVPVGGGGLIAGCATVVKALAPATRVVGVEPQASDDVARSKAAGRRERVRVGATIADGQQLPTPGELTWPVIDALVDEVVTVSDEQIVAAMVLLFERLKLVAEPSGASALAALLAAAVPAAGRRVGVVLSGANIDAARFAGLVG
jgi:threonine dehydratase